MYKKHNAKKHSENKTFEPKEIIAFLFPEGNLTHAEPTFPALSFGFLTQLYHYIFPKPQELNNIEHAPNETLNPNPVEAFIQDEHSDWGKKITQGRFSGANMMTVFMIALAAGNEIIAEHLPSLIAKSTRFWNATVTEHNAHFGENAAYWYMLSVHDGNEAALEHLPLLIQKRGLGLHHPSLAKGPSQGTTGLYWYAATLAEGYEIPLTALPQIVENTSGSAWSTRLTDHGPFLGQTPLLFGVFAASEGYEDALAVLPQFANKQDIDWLATVSTGTGNLSRSSPLLLLIKTAIDYPEEARSTLNKVLNQLFQKIPDFGDKLEAILKQLNPDLRPMGDLLVSLNRAYALYAEQDFFNLEEHLQGLEHYASEVGNSDAMFLMTKFYYETQRLKEGKDWMAKIPKEDPLSDKALFLLASHLFAEVPIRCEHPKDESAEIRQLVKAHNASRRDKLLQSLNVLLSLKPSCAADYKAFKRNIALTYIYGKEADQHIFSPTQEDEKLQNLEGNLDIIKDLLDSKRKIRKLEKRLGKLYI